MIIAINGRVGSGKDTVGKMIQDLTTRTIDTGKTIEDEFGNPMKDWDHNRHFSKGYLTEKITVKWEIKKFAGKLKTIASLLTGIPVEKFEDQEFKKTRLSDEWKFCLDYNKNVNKHVKHAEPTCPEDMQLSYTVREFLQRLGTEGIRDIIHPNAWVNALFADYTHSPKIGGYQRSVKDKNGIPYDFEYEIEYPNWIITDCRFQNEAKAVKGRGGLVIRVVRPGQDNTDLHPSEIDLDNWDFDHVIVNDGTLEDLLEKVKVFLNTYAQ